MEGPDVDDETVRHVADLAYVDIDEAEVDRYATQFAEILEWFEALDTVPEAEVDPELTNVLRPDEIRSGLEQAEALANAAETEDGYFRGPPVG